MATSKKASRNLPRYSHPSSSVTLLGELASSSKGRIATFDRMYSTYLIWIACLVISYYLIENCRNDYIHWIPEEPRWFFFSWSRIGCWLSCAFSRIIYMKCSLKFSNLHAFKTVPYRISYGINMCMYVICILRWFLTFALRILTAHNLWCHSRAFVHARIENMADLPWYWVLSVEKWL